jgi:hypothetical protein
MTKKKVYWYGVRTVAYDLSISKAEVIKETPKRIYFRPDSETVYRRGSMLKSSSYEKWFPTREEAVAWKLKFLKRNLKSATEGKTEAANRLKEFKEAENV